MSRTLVLIALGLTGCAHVGVSTDGLTYSQRRARLEAVERWDMHGRLAIDTGEQAFQGRFRWQQRADALSLLIRGPLGAGVLEVSGEPDGLRVTARGDTRELEDPELELSAMLGWWLPVGSLHAWLLGIPDARYPARRDFGPDGLLAGIKQRRWRLRYPGHQLADTLLVPRRIDLQHAGLEIRVIVDRWERLP